jgi:hypothetical protein
VGNIEGKTTKLTKRLTETFAFCTSCYLLFPLSLLDTSRENHKELIACQQRVLTKVQYFELTCSSPGCDKVPPILRVPAGMNRVRTMGEKLRMTTTNVVFELPDKKAFKTVLLFSYLSD